MSKGVLPLPAAPVDLARRSDRLAYARQVLETEAQALHVVAQRLGESFAEATEVLYACRGRVGVTGTGKSADVARKLAGTLNSTGTCAYFLDATAAVHGDLGMVGPEDVVLLFSHSGESDEIVRLLEPLATLAQCRIGITGREDSTLAQRADIAIVLGPLTEACPLGLAPSTSTTAMLALGDALAFVLCRMRGFTKSDFARYHPAGTLGRRLMRVEAVMRRGQQLRLAHQHDTVRRVFAASGRRGRRTGAVMLVDDQGKLSGLFTDSDLARLIEQRRDDALDRPIAEVMTREPVTIRAGCFLEEAVEILRRRKISELPVVDAEGRPIGLVDITDVIALLPQQEAREIEAAA
ncbi:MAG: KpsF/GutQ family sugar-phosphate isomerase [Gemmataceae bacterium]